MSLGFGLGARPVHYNDIFEMAAKGTRAKNMSVDWFEVISENFMGLGATPQGRPLETLLKLRAHFPIVLHGVSMSIGGTDAINIDYLKNLKELIHQVQPAWVSDHLCWTGVHGKNLHDLLPLPYTDETLNHLSTRIQQVQDFLDRNIILENVSSYLSFEHSTYSESEFLAKLHQKTGVELLLDVNNIYVSSVNHSFSAEKFINEIPVNAVKQIHLAGHSKAGNVLIDTHDESVCQGVWDLYAHALRRFGDVSSMVEWDGKIPPFNDLVGELDKARNVAARTLKQQALKTQQDLQMELSLG